MEEGTVLYLDSDNLILDSAKIQNNIFNFRTPLKESPTQVVLRTKDFSHYRFLWLEDTLMTFDATKSDFRKAKVTGSYEENLSQELERKTDSLPRDKQLAMDMGFVKVTQRAFIVRIFFLSILQHGGKKKQKNYLKGFLLKTKITRTEKEF